MKNLHADPSADNPELDDLSPADLERIREADKEEHRAGDVLLTLAKKVSGHVLSLSGRYPTTPPIAFSVSHTPRQGLVVYSAIAGLLASLRTTRSGSQTAAVGHRHPLELDLRSF